MIGGLGAKPAAVAHRLELLDVLAALAPFVLHDEQHAEAELGDDLGRFRADRAGIEAPLGIGDRPRPDRHARDLEELALVLEHFVAQRLDHDLRRLGEARPRLAHRDAEAFVLGRGGAAPEAEQAAPAAHDVEQRDLLGDPHRVVPRQHDHRGAELDALGAAGEVGQQLGRRRRHGVAGEVMLQRPQRVEAERLDQIAHRRSARAPRRRQACRARRACSGPCRPSWRSSCLFAGIVRPGADRGKWSHADWRKTRRAVIPALA